MIAAARRVCEIAEGLPPFTSGAFNRALGRLMGELDTLKATDAGRGAR